MLLLSLGCHVVHSSQMAPHSPAAGEQNQEAIKTVQLAQNFLFYCPKPVVSCQGHGLLLSPSSLIKPPQHLWAKELYLTSAAKPHFLPELYERVAGFWLKVWTCCLDFSPSLWPCLVITGPDLDLLFVFQVWCHTGFIAVVFSYNLDFCFILAVVSGSVLPSWERGNKRKVVRPVPYRCPLAPDLPSLKQQQCSHCFLVAACCTNLIFAVAAYGFLVWHSSAIPYVIGA